MSHMGSARDQPAVPVAAPWPCLQQEYCSLFPCPARLILTWKDGQGCVQVQIIPHSSVLRASDNRNLPSCPSLSLLLLGLHGVPDMYFKLPKWVSVLMLWWLMQSSISSFRAGLLWHFWQIAGLISGEILFWREFPKWLTVLGSVCLLRSLGSVCFV